MTAAELRTLAAEAATAARLIRGTTDQVHLRGLTAEAESFGLPPTVPHLIAKLRNLDPALLATVTNRKQGKR